MCCWKLKAMNQRPRFLHKNSVVKRNTLWKNTNFGENPLDISGKKIPQVNNYRLYNPNVCVFSQVCRNEKMENI